MADNFNVSNPVIRRLPRYYRYLSDILASGKTRISSTELAQRMSLTASQIRHDFNCFGGFGQQGYGYNVQQLTSEIEKILYLDKKIPAILIGVGNLGKALCSYLENDAPGINLIGLFDKQPELCKPSSGLTVNHIDAIADFCAERKPKLAILCIPGDDAPKLAKKLCAMGITGFWNFSHVELEVGSVAEVENVHLGDSLMTLGYKVNSIK